MFEKCVSCLCILFCLSSSSRERDAGRGAAAGIPEKGPPSPLWCVDFDTLLPVFRCFFFRVLSTRPRRGCQLALLCCFVLEGGVRLARKHNNGAQFPGFGGVGLRVARGGVVYRFLSPD